MSHEPVVGAGQSRGVKAANGVYSDLNSLTWSQAFDLNRAYVAILDKSDLKRLSIFVQHAGTRTEKITRNRHKETHTLMVIVRKNVDPANTVSVDALSRFVEEVGDYFRGDDFSRKVYGTNAYITDVTAVPPNPDKLETDREFFAGVEITVVELAP